MFFATVGERGVVRVRFSMMKCTALTASRAETAVITIFTALAGGGVLQVLPMLTGRCVKLSFELHPVYVSKQLVCLWPKPVTVCRDSCLTARPNGQQSR